MSILSIEIHIVNAKIIFVLVIKTLFIYTFSCAQDFRKNERRRTRRMFAPCYS